MTMSYILGGLTFPTKQAIAKHASAVLNRSGLGEVLNGPDDSFARDLLAHHPEADRKHGVGISAIIVALIPEWGTRNFLVLHEDGTDDNWSIKKCITNLRPVGRSIGRN
ncbi:DCL family protein [Jonesiaceae bacterium BS-20]|uniref:DCL family protein n=1 Tax=Jonesiaceae bacterium BS-20 TaxID=3120821 RepID=A0AAU7DVP6_9MICO